jgi:hypothetical protein
MRTVPKGARKRKHPSPPSILTDHALLRFLERERIIDVRQFRNMLLTAGLRAACKESGEIGSTIKYNENGLQFVIYNGKVVTIVTQEMCGRK